MGRGYYGVFHQVRLALQKEGIKISANIEAHQEVVQALQTSVDRQRRKLGMDLSTLRKYRNRADYADDLGNVAQQEAESMQTRAIVEKGLAQLGGERAG